MTLTLFDPRSGKVVTITLPDEPAPQHARPRAQMSPREAR